ncbi:MAG: ABC transporter ATP-binding protein [Pseudomonadota bacterium]
MSEATPETPPNALVALDDVHLNLRSAAGVVNILRGVSLLVDRGEHVAVVGPSGSGKSTMMAVIGGLEQATSGRVEVAGRDLAGMDEDALAAFRRDHVGIVFQAFHLVPTMTALENVALPLELAGADDAFERAQTALGEVGLDERVEHFPAQLSGGEQQRVALARAMIGEPGLLLADEPTGNLDTSTGDEVVELLFGHAQEAGAGLILITHNEALAARCDRTVHMRDGRLDGDVAA